MLLNRYFFKLQKTKLNMSFSSKYSKNVFFLQLVYGIREFIFFFSVIYILFLQTYIENYTLISVLLTLALILNIIFEYITGVFTDIYGRANSIKLAQISFIISIIIFLLSTSFIGFIFAITFLALGGALNSGSTEALLYESLKKDNKKSTFTSKLSFIQVLVTSMGIITNFVAPLVFDIDPKYPFLISLLFAIIGLIISFNLIETQSQLRKYNYKESKLMSKTILKKNINLIFKNSLFLKITLFFTIFGAIIASFGDLFNQPLIFEQFDALSYGVIFATATIIQTLVVYFTPKLIDILKDFFYTFLTILWVICLFVILYFQNLYLTIVFMGILWSIGSFTYIFISQKIQNSIEDDEIRSSTHSFINLLKSAMTGVIILIGGILIDLYSLNFSLIILNSIFVSLSFIIAIILIFSKKSTLEHSNS